MAKRKIDQTDRPFGVEQEHFILHADGTPPNHSEMDLLYFRLKGSGFRTRATDRQGRILSVAAKLREGELVVCNDACTHILEVAFPVFNSLDHFRNVYVETWDLLHSVLQSLGLKIHYGGALEPRSEIFWRPKETDPDGTRLARFLSRTPLNNPLYHQDFPAWFAATHVSLTLPDAEAYRLLPKYYAFEFLSPLAFSTSRKFQGVERHCIRPLAWFQNFPEEDPLVGIPGNIPTEIAEYDRARESACCRDYSFVSIRGGNRLEFRSTCSQETVDDLIDAIQLRLAVDRLVQQMDLPIQGISPRADFLEVAEEGMISNDQTENLLWIFLNGLQPETGDDERLYHRIESALLPD